MEEIKKRGPKPKAPGKRKVQVRYFIKQEIVDKYGEDKLLRPEIVKENSK
jgi:hypothetical protein